MAKPASNPGLEQGSDRLQCVPSKRRQKDGGCRVERTDASTQRLLLGMGQPIYLVEDQDLRSIAQIEVFENVFDPTFLLFPARV